MRFSLKEANYDYNELVKSSVYDIELDLRREYSKQYYEGSVDYNHGKWNYFLSFHKIKTVSKHFWKEIIFHTHYKVNDLEYKKKVMFKYDLVDKSDFFPKYICNNNLYKYDLEFNHNKHIDDSSVLGEFH